MDSCHETWALVESSHCRIKLSLLNLLHWVASISCFEKAVGKSKTVIRSDVSSLKRLFGSWHYEAFKFYHVVLKCYRTSTKLSARGLQGFLRVTFHAYKMCRSVPAEYLPHRIKFEASRLRFYYIKMYVSFVYHFLTVFITRVNYGLGIMRT